jgi:hypothetical protein
MNLIELHNTSIHLDWEEDDDGASASFTLGDDSYGISVKKELVESSIFVRIDFHSVTAGGIQHAATNTHGNAFRVLGVVVNGITTHFRNVDGYFFVAKKRLYPQEYEKRKSIFSRMAYKLHIEHSLLYRVLDEADSTAYVLARTAEAMRALDIIIGDDE